MVVTSRFTKHRRTLELKNLGDHFVALFQWHGKVLTITSQ